MNAGPKWTSGLEKGPTRLGRYVVESLVGRGATASVFRCRHDSLDKLAALKVLHPHLCLDKVARERFLREGRALSRVTHRNVVEVLDVGEADGVPYIVMSLVEGEELGEYARRHAPLSVSQVVDCLLPVIAAVHAAHTAGVVHRDLKPSNIRIAREPCGNLTPKVLDFGLSKFVAGKPDADLTETDGGLGTASYMPPEQLRSARDADARSDVYALGVILYECATGARPFRGENNYDVMHAIMTAPVDPPSSVRADIPRDLDAIVLRALRREPGERFASAQQLGRALAPFSSNAPVWTREFDGSSGPTLVVRPESNVDPQPPSLTMVSRTTPWRLAASGRTWTPVVLAAAVLVGAVVIAIKEQPEPAPRVALRSPVAPPTGLGTASASAPTQPVLAPRPDPPREPSRAPQNGNLTVAAPMRRASPPPRPPSLSAPGAKQGAARDSDDVGTNGAPIVE